MAFSPFYGTKCRMLNVACVQLCPQSSPLPSPSKRPPASTLRNPHKNRVGRGAAGRKTRRQKAQATGRQKQKHEGEGRALCRQRRRGRGRRGRRRGGRRSVPPPRGPAGGNGGRSPSARGGREAVGVFPGLGRGSHEAGAGRPRGVSLVSALDRAWNVVRDESAIMIMDLRPSRLCLVR